MTQMGLMAVPDIFVMGMACVHDHPRLTSAYMIMTEIPYGHLHVSQRVLMGAFYVGLFKFLLAFAC